MPLRAKKKTLAEAVSSLCNKVLLAFFHLVVTSSRADSKALFGSTVFSFYHPSHQMFGHMHEVLNIYYLQN